MRAALFHQHGEPDVLRVEQVATPAPGRGEVLVQVQAVALNHLDLWVRRGLPIGTRLPHIGGSDIAGVVAEVGADVDVWAPGDRVVVNPSLGCGICPGCVQGQESMCVRFRLLGEHTAGGFAEYCVVPATNLHPLPGHVAFETAAAIPVSYATAWRALISRARLRAGEEVLVLGASGGTAIAALQIARLAGARVRAVTSGARNAARLRELGAEVVYDREQVDFSTELHRDTGKRGVDVVVENVGAATWSRSLRSLARGGRLVTYGATSGPVGDTDIRIVFWKQLEIIGSTMASRAEFRQVLDVVVRGEIQPVIDSVLPLEQIRRAHEILEAGEQFGKIVLRP